MSDSASLTAANTSNSSRPDYESDAYRVQHDRWTLVRDVKEGIEAIRRNKERYLPRFESETPKDYASRVNMTFANNYYAQTLTDHVGLVFAEDPALSNDVPPQIEDLLENVDGEGTHWAVFAQNAFEVSLDLGHGAIWTDFPAIELDANQKPIGADGTTMRLDEFQQRQARPYWTLLGADEIISWRTVKIGGIEHLVQFVRREDITTDDGEYGSTCVSQYRVITQDVLLNAQGHPVSLGVIRWQLFREKARTAGQAGASAFDEIGNGTIGGPTQGPKTIPLRIFYGHKIATLVSKPFLYDLAWTSIEETQIASDDASVRHRCNVPTPWFTGLNLNETVNMSQGIILPINGAAGYLEPAGTSLASNRQKLEDVRAQMERQGATIPAGDKTMARMTATQAAQVARQRNARLAKAARSLQDAMEGALEDMAAFLKLPDGGSVEINKDFAGAPVDPQFVTVCLEAYKEGAILREELRGVLQNGQLPESADEVAVAQILDKLQQAKDAADAKAQADQRAQLSQLAPNAQAPPIDQAA